jgi:ABC-type dipeptide/oligopeptide/nickel transport system permease component
MLRFTIERLVGMAVTMLLVSMMVFIIMELPTGRLRGPLRLSQILRHGRLCDRS